MRWIVSSADIAFKRAVERNLAGIVSYNMRLSVKY